MGFKTNQTEFSYYTLIREIHQEADRCFLVLERSEFFAEGGGQPSDQGTIADHSVQSVYEVGNHTWHEIDNSAGLFEGMRVKVEIDAFFRLEMSRQHTDRKSVV